MNTKEIGNLGEDIACRYLEKQGFVIIERNYWKKWGEIDVVARETGGKLHFVEVKTVSCLPAHAGENTGIEHRNFSRETEGEYRPEDNVHPQKLKRMRRVIQSYLLEKNNDQYDWQFDVLTVKLNIKDKIVHCRLLSDIVL